MPAIKIESKMAGQLSQSAMVEIQRMMDTTTADPNKIPGCVAVVVDRDGKTLFQGASGKRGVDSKEPMTLDTVFWIASFTKTIGGIAAMQLAEQGKLALDDADFVEKLCPELKTVRILKGFDEHGKPELVDKKNRITLRMLLNNTGILRLWPSIHRIIADILGSWLWVWCCHRAIEKPPKVEY